MNQVGHYLRKRKKFIRQKLNVARFKQFAHLTAACGLKFCSSILYSGDSTMICLKERERTVAVCGIWNVKLLWNTIERSPSQSLICRVSNQLRFRSLLNYFWASQCFIPGGAEVFRDFCESRLCEEVSEIFCCSVEDSKSLSWRRSVYFVIGGILRLKFIKNYKRKASLYFTEVSVSERCLGKYCILVVRILQNVHARALGELQGFTANFTYLP